MSVPDELRRYVPRTDLYDSAELISYHMPVEQPPATASYIIFKKGNKTYAKNGVYGHIEYEDTDASTVIQSAINALSTGSIIIKKGIYELANELNLSDKSIQIFGEHREYTVLKRAGNVIKIENSNPLSAEQGIYNIKIDGVDRSGTGLKLNNVIRCEFGRLNIVNCDIGIDIISCRSNTFTSLWVENCNIGIKLEQGTSGSNANTFIGGEIHNGNPGVLIYGTANNNKFIGMVIEGGYQTQVEISSAVIDGAEYIPNANAFIGCWFESTHTSPVMIDFTTDTGGSRSGRATIIAYNHFTASNDYVAVDLHDSQNMFIENHIYGTVTVTINVDGAGHVVRGTRRAKLSATNLVINISGSGHIIKDNDGFVTENSGTATISAGNTSVTVSHGLADTPSKVLVTPIGDPGDRYWVANIGASSFDIVVATAPTADIDFYWQAEV